MNGVAIISELLLAHPPVSALVAPANIVAGLVPVTAMPAIAIKEIGRSENATVSHEQANALVTARIQVTVYGTTYAQQKALLQAAKLGIGAHAGIIAGATVRSVTRDSVGADVYQATTGVFEQGRDFLVTYLEPN